MAVNLRDRSFTDTGLPLQGATAQAILVTGGGTDAGTSSVVQSTTTTDVNGVWKFTSLPDPGAGNWYDVKVTNGNQVRWHYGNIQSTIALLNIPVSYTVVGGNTWDFTAGHLVLPVEAAATGTGRIGLTTAGGSVWFGDGTVSRTLVTLDQTQTLTNKTLTTPTINNGTISGATVNTLGPTVTGTGSLVGAASPTFTGTVTLASLSETAQFLNAFVLPAISNSAYSDGNIQLQGLSNTAPRIGFHQPGSSAVALYKEVGTEALKVRGAGGTDAYLVTDTGTQTLTNKTLTSPTLTSPNWTGSMTHASAANSASAPLALEQNTGPKISLYDGGAGNFYGFGINGSEMYASVPTGTAFNLRVNNGSGSKYPVLTGNVNQAQTIVDGGTIFFSGIGAGATAIATNYNGAFSSPPIVVCTLNGISGGDSTTHLLSVSERTIGTNGFVAVVDNQSGGSQSVTVDWIAIGPR